MFSLVLIYNLSLSYTVKSLIFLCWTFSVYNELKDVYNLASSFIVFLTRYFTSVFLNLNWPLIYITIFKCCILTNMNDFTVIRYNIEQEVSQKRSKSIILLLVLSVNVHVILVWESKLANLLFKCVQLYNILSWCNDILCQFRMQM